jgi:hypothetical protein
MTAEEYVEQLAACLQRFGLEGEPLRDIVAEVESHLMESGEDPVQAFGLPEDFADDRMRSSQIVQGPAPAWETRTFRATAFDEMDVLAAAGLVGWELMAVGLMSLHCRRRSRPEDRVIWTYRRRTGLARHHFLQEMIGEGWTQCGSWPPFSYFKRPESDVR